MRVAFAEMTISGVLAESVARSDDVISTQQTKTTNIEAVAHKRTPIHRKSLEFIYQSPIAAEPLRLVVECVYDLQGSKSNCRKPPVEITPSSIESCVLQYFFMSPGAIAHRRGPDGACASLMSCVLFVELIACEDNN